MKDKILKANQPAADKPNERREKLTRDDLEGLVVTRLVLYKPTRNPNVKRFVVEYEVKRYTIFVVGEPALNSLIDHGFKKGDDIYFRVPRWLLSENGPSWLREPY